MKYKCASCQAEFPAKDAVDGFNQGFKDGFLCPLCNCNLIDCKESWVMDAAIFIIPFTIALTGVGFGSSRFNRATENPVWEVFLGGLAIAILLLPVIFIRMVLRSKKTIQTKVIKHL